MNRKKEYSFERTEQWLNDGSAKSMILPNVITWPVSRVDSSEMHVHTEIFYDWLHALLGRSVLHSDYPIRFIALTVS